MISIADKEDHNALAERACSDEMAFAQLYNAYIDQIYGFVMKRIGHPETSEDLVSEIFRKVFTNLEAFDSSKASFRTWLYRIANNTIIDHYRVTRNPNKPAVVDIDSIQDLASQTRTPEEIVLNSDEREFMQACINELPEKQQKVVQLKYIEGFSHEEIAEVMGMTPNNIGVISHRALKKMKVSIEKKQS
ncbi:MAG: RNA polymerase sigma factor [Candidatus Kerfeldbacteria bacterium]